MAGLSSMVFGKAIGEDGIVGDRTRGAYFDILEDTLARQAGGVEALAALRAKTRFVDDQRRTLPCGERFPIERPGEDGVASAKNRRVELLYFPPAFEPDLSVDDIAERIYDRRLFRDVANVVDNAVVWREARSEFVPEKGVR